MTACWGPRSGLCTPGSSDTNEISAPQHAAPVSSGADARTGPDSFPNRWEHRGGTGKHRSFLTRKQRNEEQNFLETGVSHLPQPRQTNQYSQRGRSFTGLPEPHGFHLLADRRGKGRGSSAVKASVAHGSLTTDASGPTWEAGAL